jgi:hypothetical protein
VTYLFLKAMHSRSRTLAVPAEAPVGADV